MPIDDPKTPFHEEEEDQEMTVDAQAEDEQVDPAVAE